jgi:hypothetical protein
MKIRVAGVILTVLSAGLFAIAQDVDVLGDLRVDINGLNNGLTSPGIRFGSGLTGEGISSDRQGSFNHNGIDFFTASTPRVSIANGGNVGIGTGSPQATLDVAGQVIAEGFLTERGNRTIIAGFDGANNHWFGPVADSDLAFGINRLTANNYNFIVKGDVTASNIIGLGKVVGLAKAFKIDHPLYPDKKYLYHSSVESSEMMDMYTGNVTLNVSGQATVQLPDWFEALNKDFRYELTSLGRPQPGVYIAEEVSDNRFKIAGGKPGGRVSWQVTGVRHDAYAKAYPIPVEEDKPQGESGHYLIPELFGATKEQGIGYHAPLVVGNKPVGP